MIHCPLERRTRQWDISRVEISECQERDNTLRHTVSIDGMSVVIKVSDGAVLAEKVSLIELKSAPDAVVELGCFDIPANGL
jgi:hypothetical protein